jgi:hypothetical protein
MEYRQYQRAQLEKENKAHTRRTVFLVLLMIVTLPTCIFAANFVLTLRALKTSRVKANESHAVNILRKTESAQSKRFYRRGEYGTFEQLHEEGLLDENFYTVRQGYVFILNVSPAVEGRPPAYSVTADPLDSDGFFSATGSRRFFISSRDSAIHFNNSRTATTDDPAFVEE